MAVGLVLTASKSRRTSYPLRSEPIAHTTVFFKDFQLTGYLVLRLPEVQSQRAHQSTQRPFTPYAAERSQKANIVSN